MKKVGRKQKWCWIISHSKERLQVLFSLSFCYSLFFWVNFINKELYCDTMNVATALSSFQKLCNLLKTSREKSFDETLNLLKILDAKLVLKKLLKMLMQKEKKNYFHYESVDEQIQTLTGFNQVIDKSF